MIVSDATWVGAGGRLAVGVAGVRSTAFNDRLGRHGLG